jgi:hypothetical protein
MRKLFILGALLFLTVRIFAQNPPYIQALSDQRFNGSWVYVDNTTDSPAYSLVKTFEFNGTNVAVMTGPVLMGELFIIKLDEGYLWYSQAVIRPYWSSLGAYSFENDKLILVISWNGEPPKRATYIRQ